MREENIGKEVGLFGKLLQSLIMFSNSILRAFLFIFGFAVCPQKASALFSGWDRFF